MTFEATETCASAAAVDETMARPSRPARRGVRPEHPADTMLKFVVKSEHVASDLRGLALLFRGVFVDDQARASDDAGAAADILDDVLKSIAARLDANAEQARVTRNHLTGDGAR